MTQQECVNTCQELVDILRELNFGWFDGGDRSQRPDLSGGMDGHVLGEVGHFRASGHSKWVGLQR